MVDVKDIDLEQEKKEILNAYRGLLRACKRSRDREDTKIIRKAFDVAMEAHKDMRRKSGEPYIYHPIAVARICAEEIGLGTTSIVCALLHDTVEDTDMTLENIEAMFGKKARMIIDGLTKMSGVFDQSTSLQAENFRKMLLTLSDDVRVILIKLADRLHNMRTLGSMRRDKQLKIASETSYLYAPLSHRLGLYSVKSELEDLSLKYKEPEVYAEILGKLKKGQAVRTRFVNRFISPLKRELVSEGFNFEIKGRPKSIYSIWNKMRKKGIPFEEVYDLFAIRVILDIPLESEKPLCWRVYSIVTDFYQPNPDRLRDWVSTPKGNGYESLHTTVMSPTGKWVEVQIRSKRMDDIAEKGYAAHWKYKEASENESGLDVWLDRIRDMLDNPEENALDFIDDFKMNLFSDEIFIFTPSGELRTLPAGATTLDFAFDIHSQIGAACIGAKVNHRLVPLSHELKSGDQVEIITSTKQKPKSDWLDFVVTARAKTKIKTSLKEEHKITAIDGKEILQRKFRQLKAGFNGENVTILVNHYKLDNATELYYRIAKGNIDLKAVKKLMGKGGNLKPKVVRRKPGNLAQLVTNVKGKADLLVIGDSLEKIDYTLAPCCNPISGDDVFGFVTVQDGIRIHRVSCPNATALMSNYAYRIVKARWSSQELIEFQTGIRFTGIDEVGLVNQITRVISTQNNVNMRSISFATNDGVFEGTVMVFVHDTDHLDRLMINLKKVNGVLKVERITIEE
jgi:guanosine-3',5'-bis(diphosphate) 3'-pyrophosphohydrolase